MCDCSDTRQSPTRECERMEPMYQPTEDGAWTVAQCMCDCGHVDTRQCDTQERNASERIRMEPNYHLTRRPSRWYSTWITGQTVS